MKWRISFSRHAERFLDDVGTLTEDDVLDLAAAAVKKLQGEDVNVDIKKLKGPWASFFRIRRGNVRIIVEFDFDNSRILIERIDYRGRAYR